MEKMKWNMIGLTCFFFSFQVDEEADELIAHIKLQDGNTEYWKSRFLGESLTNVHEKDNLSDSEILDVTDDIDLLEDGTKDAEEDEVDEEEVVEQTENQEGDITKEKEVERAKPPQMIGVQLLKDSEETSSAKKSRTRVARASIEVCHYIFPLYIMHLSSLYMSQYTHKHIL